MKGSKKSYRIPKIFQVQLSTRNNIFAPEEFKALVRYERMRADRNGSVFSVAVFSFPANQRQIPPNLVIDMSKFTRAIDCIGMDEGGRISVLLPDTSGDGASSFAQKVLDGLDELYRCHMTVELYSYPDHWLVNSAEPAKDQCAQMKSVRSFRELVESYFVVKVPGWKRALDVCVSALMLVFVSPVFLLTALFLKIVSPGPVFFKQTRIGYKGRPFMLYKFRTMKYENNQTFHGKHAQSFIKDGNVPMVKLDGRDPRIFFGGHVLRKTCIDELPQLWNILRGDMSLVGPRPCIPYEAQEYLRWHTHRFDTMPGLSGLWQVSGKNKLTFKQMIRLDITYCQHITPLGDLAIILRTPFAIVKMIVESVIDKRNEKKRKDKGIMGDSGIVFTQDTNQLVNS